ncbi:MAG: MYXO-CTERM sorting domain-containing protein, partial [Myxococcota bacterium]
AAVLVPLGFALGITASCDVLTGEDYNFEAMALAVEIDEKCSMRPGDNERTPTPYAIYKAEDLAACEQQCRFREPAARKCLRRLERMAESCGKLNLAVCRRVYVDCGPKFDHNRCDMARCSVAPDGAPAGAVFALSLLALGMHVRRRRR